MTPLDLTIRVSLVLAAALAFGALVRRRPAALRHWILAAGIVCTAVTPALETFAPSWHAPFAATSRPAIPAATKAPPADVRATADVIVSRPPATSPPRRFTVPGAGAIAAAVWIAGAAFAVFGLFVGIGRLVWIGRHADTLTDPTWRDACEDVARELGISRRVRLLESDRPLLVTWGLFAPKVIVPRTAAGWPRERVRVVLAHELAHIARRDWPVQIAAEVIRAAHWFNPLAWIACRRLRLESEHACDDAVMALGIDASDYASHLLDLARSMNARRSAWIPAEAIVRPSSLERRITAMLNAHVDRSPLTTGRRVGAAAAIAIVTLLAAGYSSAQGLTILTGTIADQVGGVMPNIPIVLTDLTTNATHEVRTNALGHYEFVGLPSGDYMLRIDKVPGFTSVQQRIVLTGATLKRDVRMRIGTIQETVTVVSNGVPAAPPPGPNREQAQRRMRDQWTSGCDTPGGCIAPPIKTGDKRPVYPSTYTGDGDVVTLKGVIDATGHVSKLRVVGQPDPDLAQAALAAVGQWEFEPTRLDGIVVETDLNVTVNFKSTR